MSHKLGFCDPRSFFNTPLLPRFEAEFTLRSALQYIRMHFNFNYSICWPDFCWHETGCIWSPDIKQAPVMLTHIFTVAGTRKTFGCTDAVGKLRCCFRSPYKGTEQGCSSRPRSGGWYGNRGKEISFQRLWLDRIKFSTKDTFLRINQINECRSRQCCLPWKIE